jgi:hypothetical protein
MLPKTSRLPCLSLCWVPGSFPRRCSIHGKYASRPGRRSIRGIYGAALQLGRLEQPDPRMFTRSPLEYQEADAWEN